MRRLAWVICASLVPLAGAAQERDVKTIMESRSTGAPDWQIVNDGVMGGLSRSEMGLTGEGTALFRGFVSLDNNGGFASTRTPVATDLGSYDGVVLRVRGDGRSYQFRFRTNDMFDGVAYRADFETEAGEWVEVVLPFEAFRPNFRGYVPRGAGPLDPARIRQMGFLIGDKREGPFRLEVAWVKAYRQTDRLQRLPSL